MRLILYTILLIFYTATTLLFYINVFNEYYSRTISIAATIPTTIYLIYLLWREAENLTNYYVKIILTPFMLIYIGFNCIQFSTELDPENSVVREEERYEDLLYSLNKALKTDLPPKRIKILTDHTLVQKHMYEMTKIKANSEAFISTFSFGITMSMINGILFILVGVILLLDVDLKIEERIINLFANKPKKYNEK